MGKRKITLIGMLTVAFCLMAMLTGCGANVIKGEGGIAPEGYYKVEKAGSSFYLPEEAKKTGTSNGAEMYQMEGGSINVVVTDKKTAITKMTKKSMENALQAQILAQGLNWDFTIDVFTHYELSGLRIVYDEVTITTQQGGSTLTIKEYQCNYDSGDKQICITIALQDANAETDIPEKILHSIALLS